MSNNLYNCFIDQYYSSAQFLTKIQKHNWSSGVYLDKETGKQRSGYYSYIINH